MAEDSDRAERRTGGGAILLGNKGKQRVAEMENTQCVSVPNKM